MKFDWIVMPGLDPGIHAELPRVKAPTQQQPICRMDCRIKSGNDEAVLIMLYASISSVLAGPSFAAATISNISAP